MPLSTFPLPLPPDGPPDGYGWEERDVSLLSTTTAFQTGIDRRDQFLGGPRCIICGVDVRSILQHCHIIRQSEMDTWTMLKDRHWIPQEAKSLPQHEPRDGLLMCNFHHALFDEYIFFIRFLPDIRKYVFVNYSGKSILQQYHGKAVALDVRDRHAPFPSLFIIHEMRVRGFNPFQPLSPAMFDDTPWQDWILSDGVFDDTSNSFIRDSLPRNDQGRSGQSQLQLQPMTSAGGSFGGRTLALNDNVITDILAATRAMPSWRACEMEGTSWTGTAEENIQKYVSIIEAQDIQ